MTEIVSWRTANVEKQDGVILWKSIWSIWEKGKDCFYAFSSISYRFSFGSVFIRCCWTEWEKLLRMAKQEGSQIYLWWFICNRTTWLAIILGQVLSVLLCTSAFVTVQLVETYNIRIPNGITFHVINEPFNRIILAFAQACYINVYSCLFSSTCIAL